MKPSFYLILILCLLHSGCLRESYSSKKEDGSLVFSISGNEVLSYRYETMPPPNGVDSAFQRSGFIHPLKTLKGHRLTQIHPEDHYHHFGVWNPWTKVLIEGDTIDFWNLGSKQGTVRFKEFEEIKDNGFTTVHEHVVLKNDFGKVALNETQKVSIRALDDRIYWVDFQIEYQTASESDFRLLQHRYGGFSIRATEEWNETNSEILTSEGTTRESADGSLAKWCMVQGQLGDDQGGFVVMSHPNNFNHPEPLRVWPKENHDGLIFVNFCPIKNKDWTLKAGNTYHLNYRIVVFDDTLDENQAQLLWEDFAATL